MNENEEMQAVDQENLQNVAGGNQEAVTMSEEDSKKITELIIIAGVMHNNLRLRLPFGPVNKELKSRLKIVTDKLKAFAKKYPDDPRLSEYREKENLN